MTRYAHVFCRRFGYFTGYGWSRLVTDARKYSHAVAKRKALMLTKAALMKRGISHHFEVVPVEAPRGR